MKPPPRKKIASRSKDLSIEEYSQWKLVERQQLLKALEKYSVNQSSEIAKMVETKSEVEVIYYLSKLKRSLKTDTSVATSSEHRKYIRNIQAWIRFTLQLVDDEEQSYSSMIGKLLALYGQNCFKKLHPTGVNFKMIYEYLAGLCVGVQCQALPPFESAIVLDLLRNVATILGKSNTAKHKEFVLLNFQNQVFPKCDAQAKKKLFAEVQAPPDSLLASLPSSSKTKMRKTHKNNISSDDFNATVVCITDSSLQEKRMKQGTWYRMPKTSIVSQHSQNKRKFPACWNTESLSNSSTSKAKMAKNLPEIFTHDTKNEFSEEIPSTDEIDNFTEQNAEYSSDLQEDPHLESQQSNGTFLTSKNIKQEFQSIRSEQNDVSDSSPDEESDPSRVVSVTRGIVQQGVQQEIDDGDANNEQTPRQTQIIPITNASEPFRLPTGEESPRVPMGDTGPYLSNENTVKKNMDNTDVIAIKTQSGGSVQKGSILSNILQSPTKVIIVQGTPDKTSKNPVNPGPESSQIPNKRSLLSHLFRCPIENVCQQNAESFRALPSPQKTVDRLNPNVHERSLLSNLLQGSNSNADTTQQEAGNRVKTLQTTSQVEGEFSASRSRQESGISRGKQQVDKSEVCQANKRAADKEPSRLERATVEGSTASQPNEKQLSDKSVETEFTDSDDGDADKFMYKPSVSWLNPMNIPAHLINFTAKK